PEGLSPDAVDAARDAWQRALKQAEDQAGFARQGAGGLEEAAETFPQRLLGLCNLVAATTSPLPAAPYFRDAARCPVRFRLLILEDADRVTEAEFLAAARRARRWVLVGQPPAVAGPEPQRPAPGKPALPAVLRPALFHRLWQQLHVDPRRLPYAWVRE